MKQSLIILEANTATLHSIIRLADGYQIDFTQSNTLRDLLGFESKILTDSYNYSKNKVNIIDIHRLHICCDCIVGSLRNGYLSNILFTVVLNEAPGAKIVREPNLVLYKHIYKEKLDAIQFWMKDDILYPLYYSSKPTLDEAHELLARWVNLHLLQLFFVFLWVSQPISFVCLFSFLRDE